MKKKVVDILLVLIAKNFDVSKGVFKDPLFMDLYWSLAKRLRKKLYSVLIDGGSVSLRRHRAPWPE